MNKANITLDYYDQHAGDYVADTRDVDFSMLQNEFASYVRSGMEETTQRTLRILDLGCGSGRDSKAFRDMGFDVVSIDGSKELSELASEYLGYRVICTTFQEYEPEGIFDGIWACSTLLHLSIDEIKYVMKKYTAVLREGGYFYVSFKYGTFSGERNGRFFTDLNERSFAEILKEIPELMASKMYITEDVRPDRRSEKWLNAFLKKSSTT